MNFLVGTLFLFTVLSVPSLNASVESAISEQARFLASLHPGSNPARIARMFGLIEESTRLDDLVFSPNDDNNKRTLIYYVEAQQKFQRDGVRALDLPRDAYETRIAIPRAAIVLRSISDVEASISTLESIIHLQKSVVLGFYEQLQRLSVAFYQRVRGTGADFAPSQIFLRLIEDERAGNTKGREIFVARLMLDEVNRAAIESVQPKSAHRKGRDAQSDESDFTLAKARELTQSLWTIAGSIATTGNGLCAHMAQTMQEFAVDVACFRAGVEFFNEGSGIKGKELRAGITRELNRLSHGEVEGRIALARESLRLAQQMNDTLRTKKVVSVLSSLVNVKALQVEDRLQQANLFLQIAMLSGRYFAEEPFETAVL